MSLINNSPFKRVAITAILFGLILVFLIIIYSPALTGYQEFFKYRVIPFGKDESTPLYFIGSIAYYFREILEKVALKYGLKVTDIIQRPIDNLLDYHRKNIN